MLGICAMWQGKTVIVVFVSLVIGFAGGFILLPVIAPSQRADALAIAPSAGPVSSEARNTQYFVANIGEARQVVAGCRNGNILGEECTNAETAIITVESKERFERFRTGQ
jgi:hypothetical protein